MHGRGGEVAALIGRSSACEGETTARAISTARRVTSTSTGGASPCPLQRAANRILPGHRSSPCIRLRKSTDHPDSSGNTVMAARQQTSSAAPAININNNNLRAAPASYSSVVAGKANASSIIKDIGVDGTSKNASSATGRVADRVDGTKSSIINVRGPLPSSPKLRAELTITLCELEIAKQQSALAKMKPMHPRDKPMIPAGTHQPVAPSKKSRRRRRRRGRPPNMGGRRTNGPFSPSTSLLTTPSHLSDSVPSVDDHKNVDTTFSPSPKRRRRRRRYRSRYRHASSATKMTLLGPSSSNILSTCRHHRAFQLPFHDGRSSKAARARFFDGPPSYFDMKLIEILQLPPLPPGIPLTGFTQ